MRVKLNLAMNEDVVNRAKVYAANYGTSVSKIVEEYLDNLSYTPKNNKRGFVEKYAGTLKGKLSDRQVKKIKDEYLKQKYGY